MITLDHPRLDLLDFPVSLRPVQTVVEGRVQDVPGSRVVYREDTGEVLDIVSRRYRLVSHAVIFPRLDELVREALPHPVRSVSTRTGRGGGYAAVEWTLDHEVEVAPGDTVALAVRASNSLDRSAALRLEVTARRLICANGLRAPGPEFGQRWKHRKDTLDVGAVGAWLEVVPSRVVPLMDRWQAWARQSVFPQRVEEWLETDSLASSTLGQRARKRIMDGLYRERDPHTVTLWQAYNALTAHASHRVKTRKRDLLVVREEEVHRVALKLAQHLEKN